MLAGSASLPSDGVDRGMTPNNWLINWVEKGKKEWKFEFFNVTAELFLITMEEKVELPFSFLMGP